jgi:hypothetical protein
MTDPAAASVLMLARGQLNKAARAHGLSAPHPMLTDGLCPIDPAESDDPAGLGIAQALARFENAFLLWSATMPQALAEPVMAILWQTRQAAGTLRPDATGLDAITAAYNFLAGFEKDAERRTEDARSRCRPPDL